MPWLFNFDPGLRRKCSPTLLKFKSFIFKFKFKRAFSAVSGIIGDSKIESVKLYFLTQRNPSINSSKTHKVYKKELPKKRDKRNKNKRKNNQKENKPDNILDIIKKNNKKIKKNIPGI